MKEIVEFIQKEIFKKFKKKYSKKYINQHIITIIEFINESENKKFLIGGSQGIGKSSFILIIIKALEKFYDKKVLGLSLDNYYLKKNERKVLSREIHPLLLTRGVPGTHDIKKLINDVQDFDNDNYPFSIPIFDKLKDDRLRKPIEINEKYDLLILEGWCCGTKYLDKSYLKKNINILERKFDQSLKWRNFYNKKLKNEYQSLFNLFDIKIFMKAPSFKYVLNWRLKQETNNKSKLKNVKKMNINEIKRFIQHYEKITKWMLKNSNNFADLIIKIDKKQNITSIKKN
ncbi:MAG: hypothetical protein CBD97_02230 [Pelagibacteraceae bacterium TMED237]|nr:MAG: hypothetical protein CBD97_02230 [Pelagibacteraceae bacterium TMED237]|tara:strand:+ start:7112 stop:7972 length:861 start_codon:yes stop_codon:yes gene_type:complete